MIAQDNNLATLLIEAFKFVDIDGIEFVNHGNVNSILSFGNKKSLIKSEESARKLLQKIKSQNKEDNTFDRDLATQEFTQLAVDRLQDYIESDIINITDGEYAALKASTINNEPNRFHMMKHSYHAYIIMLLVESFIMGRRVGTLEGILVGNQNVHDNYTVLGGKQSEEELVAAILSQTGSRKGLSQREAALTYMEEMLKEDPSINKYQLAKRTREDSDNNPQKYSRKSAIPMSTCNDYASIAKDKQQC